MHKALKKIESRKTLALCKITKSNTRVTNIAFGKSGIAIEHNQSFPPIKRPFKHNGNHKQGAIPKRHKMTDHYSLDRALANNIA